MAEQDDWRQRGRESYLQGATLCWKRYARWSDTWDHDHCAFCWVTFSDSEDVPEALQEGYTMVDHEQFPDGYHWICSTCYEDFSGQFQWRLTTAPTDLGASSA